MLAPFEVTSLPTRIPRALAALPAHDWARIVGYLALYFALVWLTFTHPMRGLNITPWNPQSALAVALLMWRPRCWWLVWLAAFTGKSLIPDTPVPWVALLMSTALVTAGFAAVAAALKRWIWPHRTLLTRRRLVAFFGIVAAGALLCASLRAIALAAFGEVTPERFAAAIHRGAIGDGVGMLVTLPLLLAIGSRERRAGLRAMLATAEWWLIVAMAGAAIVFVFSRVAEEQFKFFYILFLPVVWSAARFGLTGAAAAAAVVQVTMIVAVQAGQYRPLTVFELQLLVAVLAGTGLLLGASVDEREEAGRTLRASLRLAAAGDTAAALAHELSQPLAALGTYAQATQELAERVGREDRSAAAPLLDATRKLSQEADRAAEVVKRLRDFFREHATQLAATPLQALLLEAVALQMPRAGALGVRVTCSCDPADAVVWMDRVQIGVVLRNLLANAIDAASASRAGGEAARWVSLTAVRDDGEVVVRVADGGPGLHGDELTLVFERRSSDKPAGMGMGLGISRSIVEAHGGRLWAEPGPGGRFLFTLPLGADHD